MRVPKKRSDHVGDEDEVHGVRIHLDRVLAEREMTLTRLAEEVGVTIANLSVLKSGRARAIRFSTLTRICRVLDCQPGDLLSVDPAANDDQKARTN
jgi:putative transcriptional regulator